MHPNDEWPEPGQGGAQRPGGPGDGQYGGPPEAPRGYPQPGMGEYQQAPPPGYGSAPAQPGPYAQAPGPAHPAGTPYAVAPKNPGLSLLAAFFIPGLGSMINGEVGKGVGILIGYIISWFLVIILIGVVGCVGFWVWGMIDGYQGARKWNAAHGIVS